MKRFWLDILVAALILAAGCRASRGDAAGSGRNLALGMPYRYAPAATYHLTRGADDARKLTDGRHASGNFWSDRAATAGWQNSGPIRIEIDLPGDSLVDAVSISSARGDRAGVSYPERADLFVGGEEGGYRYLGDLMSGQEHGDGGYQKRTFRAGALRARGSRALVVVRPRGNYTFIDEIEVLGRRGAPPPHPDQRPLVAPEALDRFLEERVALSVERRALAAMVRQARGATPRGGVAASELGALSDELERPIGELSPERLEALRSAMFRVRQRELSKRGDGPFLLWQGDPWGEFSPLALPAPGYRLPGEGIVMDLAQGGTFSDSIGIANATGKACSVSAKVRMEHAPGAAPVVTVREVLPVLRADFRTLGDPLRDTAEGVVIGPGESRQIWLTASCGSLPPGVYRGEIRLEAPGFKKSVPLSVRVWPVRLPHPPRAAVNAWSYLNWRPISGIPQAAAADLERHRVNVIVLHPDQLPWPGKEYKELDRVIRLHPFARHFLLYLAFNDPGRRSLGTGEAYLSPRWRQEFDRWIRETAEHMRRMGVPPASFAFYPVDEPKDEKEAEVLAETARLIKEADPALRVYTTFGDFGRFSDETFARLMTVVDRYQVGIDAIADARVRRLLGAGKEVWSYGGSGKGSHPFKSYRLQAWRAVKYGATGIGFWAYADTGPSGSAWNDFDGTRPDFSVVYETPGGILSSKRWEAWREGAEDYELLALARDRATDPFAALELGRMIDRVLAHPRDYRLFLESRRRLLELASR